MYWNKAAPSAVDKLLTHPSLPATPQDAISSEDGGPPSGGGGGFSVRDLIQWDVMQHLEALSNVGTVATKEASMLKV